MRHAPVWIAILVAVAIGVGVALHERSQAPPDFAPARRCPSHARSPPSRSSTRAGGPSTRAVRGPVEPAVHGFTHCPDVCPTTLARWRNSSGGVARDDLQFVFLSVDPERDTPDAIARYLAHFDAALVGATGARAEIERFTARTRPRPGPQSRRRGRIHGRPLHRLRADRPRGAAIRLFFGTARARRARRRPRRAP